MTRRERRNNLSSEATASHPITRVGEWRVKGRSFGFWLTRTLAGMFTTERDGEGVNEGVGTFGSLSWLRLGSNRPQGNHVRGN